jgi:uncharacterized protein (DUF2164 family)
MGEIYMYEEMAMNYFKGLSKDEKKRIIHKIFDSLSDEEKLEIAKIIVKED